MVDGAAAAENRYVIDGIETTDIVGGLSGKNLLADFVEEVQVKSTGYPAEYGGATGGVINVQTKSGIEPLQRQRGLPTTRVRTRTRRRTTRRSAPCSAIATRPNTTRSRRTRFTRFEPGGSLGGPILTEQDVVLRRVSACQHHHQTARRCDHQRHRHREHADTTQKQQIQYLSGNVTNQFGNKLRTRVAYNNSWSKTDGPLAATGGRGTATNYTKGTKFPNWALSGTADYTVSPNFLVIAAAPGRY